MRTCLMTYFGYFLPEPQDSEFLVGLHYQNYQSLSKCLLLLVVDYCSSRNVRVIQHS